jgi:hypothetical protein
MQLSCDVIGNPLQNKTLDRLGHVGRKMDEWT